jgi:S-ribosylhomocysteine lyase LuxS involved in autoinducer biosynthesis
MKVYVLVDSENKIIDVDGFGTYSCYYMPIFKTKEDAKIAKEVLEDTTNIRNIIIKEVDLKITFKGV